MGGEDQEDDNRYSCEIRIFCVARNYSFVLSCDSCYYYFSRYALVALWQFLHNLFCIDVALRFMFIYVALVVFVVLQPKLIVVGAGAVRGEVMLKCAQGW